MFSVLPPGPTPTVSTLRTAAGKKSSSMPPAGMQFLFFVWEWSVAAPCDVGRRRPPAATPSDLSFLCRLRFFLHLSVEPPPVLARWSLPPPCSPHEPSPACAGVPPHLSSDNATTAQGTWRASNPPPCSARRRPSFWSIPLQRHFFSLLGWYEPTYSCGPQRRTRPCSRRLRLACQPVAMPATAPLPLAGARRQPALLARISCFSACMTY